MRTQTRYSECIEACMACVLACEGYLQIERANEHSVYVSLCKDCAEICLLCARLIARGSQYFHEMCLVCVYVCRACAKEGDKEMLINNCCVQSINACRACEEVCESVAYLLTDRIYS